MITQNCSSKFKGKLKMKTNFTFNQPKKLPLIITKYIKTKFLGKIRQILMANSVLH